MKKYVFLFLFTIIWSVVSPFIAIFISDGPSEEGIISDISSQEEVKDTFYHTSEENSEKEFFESGDNIPSEESSIHDTNSDSDESIPDHENPSFSVDIPHSTEEILDESDTQSQNPVREKITYVFTKSAFLEIVKELCPQITIDNDDKEIIKKITTDEEGFCISINVGNSAFTSEALAAHLSLPSEKFVLEETEKFIKLEIWNEELYQVRNEECGVVLN